MAEAKRILAIDVGAGTQDILLWESDRTPENCTQLILPSQTQIVAARIRALTAAGRPLHLTGRTMGGGASSDAITAHLAAGLAVTATLAAAKTIHDNPARVAATGVRIVAVRPDGATEVVLGDVDPAALRETLARFAIPWPREFAVAVFDHGDSPDFSNRRFRFEHLARIIAAGGDLGLLAYADDLPVYLTRMAAARELLPGATVMDTGAAGVRGALEDPRVAAAAGRGAILVNLGNMHTFGILLRGRRILGLFEHHTHLLTTEKLAALVAGLRARAPRLRDDLRGGRPRRDLRRRLRARRRRLRFRRGHRPEPRPRPPARLVRGRPARRHDARRAVRADRGGKGEGVGPHPPPPAGGDPLSPFEERGFIPRLLLSICPLRRRSAINSSPTAILRAFSGFSPVTRRPTSRHAAVPSSLIPTRTWVSASSWLG